jgi:hypothetical protein
MDESEIPIYYALGNHDGREAFLQVFSGPGAQTDADGYVQYAVDFGPMRMVVPTRSCTNTSISEIARSPTSR